MDADEIIGVNGVIEDDATTGQVVLEAGLQGIQLREFEPLNSLLKILPKRAQRAIFSLNVNYTCIDVCDNYIAVGSNIGVVFLFDRKKETLQRLNTSSKNDEVTCCKMQSSLDHMIAVGMASGLVVIFQLPSILPGRNKKLQRYDVKDMHKTVISCLAWSANGIKIFSGDQNGVVCYTEFDFSKLETKSAIILKEGFEIVQLNYGHKTLLVSSKLRSILHTIEENKTIQIGQKERKCRGNFGASFIRQLCKPGDAVIYAARPGLRIWTANIHGVVSSTFIFKEMLASKHPDIALLSSSVIIKNRNDANTEQFGPMIIYNENQVVTWSCTSLYVLDLISNSVLGSHNYVGNILDVCVNKDEIFVLRSGAHRSIIRIAQKPEAPPIVSPESLQYENIQYSQSPSTAEYKHIIEQSMKSSMRRSLSATNSPTVQLQPTIIERSASPIPFISTQLIGKIKSTFDREANSDVNKIQIFSSSHQANTEILCPTPQTAAADSSSGGSSLAENISNKLCHKTNWVEDDAAIETAIDASQLLNDESQNQILPPVIPLDIREIKPVKVANSNEYIPECLSVANITVIHPIDQPEFFTQNSSESASSLMHGRFSSLKGKRDSENEDLVYESHRRNKKKKKRDKQKQKSLTSKEKSDSDSGKSADNIHLDIPDGNVPSCSDTDRTPDRSPDRPSSPVLNVNVSKNALSLDSEPVLAGLTKKSDLESSLDSFKKNPDLDSSLAHKLPLLESISDNENTEHLMFPRDLDLVPNKSSDDVDVKKNHMIDPLLCSPDGGSNLNVSVDDFYARYRAKSTDSKPSDDVDPIAEFQQKLRDSGNFNRISESEATSTDSLTALLTDTWSAFPAPGLVQSLSLSSKQVWLTDKCDKLLYSNLNEPGLTWKKDNDNAHIVAVSENGSIIWKLLRNGFVHVATRTIANPQGTKWEEVLKDVRYISVDNTCAWFITTSGEVMLQSGLSKDRPFFSSRSVSCAFNLLQIKCRSNVVWGLTDKGKAITRVGVDHCCMEGERWDDIENLPDGVGFCSFCLGDQNTAWALDVAGRLFFKTGVTSEAPVGDPHWWQISLSEYFIQDATAINNWTKSLTEFLDPQRLSKILHGYQGGLVAIGPHGVWVCPEQRNTLRVCRGIMTGHLWVVAALSGVALSMQWSHVCAQVAEGSLGIVWAQQPNGEILYMSLESKAFISVGTQRILSSLLCLSAAETAVWALTNDGKIFIRQGVTVHCPQGINWVELNLSQLGQAKLVHLSIGDSNAWAVDRNGILYFRIGVSAPTNQALNQAWIVVDDKPSNGSTFTQVEVGRKDNMVWAIDDKKSVYVRRGVTDRMPVGQEWIQVPGTQAKQLCISNDSVWALSPSGEVLARFGINEDNEVGNYWKKIPGSFSSISASPNNNLWALNSEGQLCQRTTRCFIPQQSRSSALSRGRTVSQGSSDGDWELL